MDIHVKFVHEVDSYFHLPMPKSMDGWQEVWFFVRNDANVPLPMFTGNRPIIQPNWEYMVARRDLRKLQP
jgi:hypothetical protein